MTTEVKVFHIYDDCENFVDEVHTRTPEQAREVMRNALLSFEVFNEDGDFTGSIKEVNPYDYSYLKNPPDFQWKVYSLSGILIGQVTAKDKTHALQVAKSWFDFVGSVEVWLEESRWQQEFLGWI